MHAGKTLKRPGATPSCRKIAARSLRASGVTPASFCGKSQIVFWPRRGGQRAISKTRRMTKPTRRNVTTTWRSLRHHPNNRRR